MGYYTAYNLEVENYDKATGVRSADVAPDVLKEIVAELEKRDVIGYALTEDLYCADHVKWYDHDSDMIEVSKLFPDVLFCLHGEGELNADLWDAYYLDGKMQDCQATVVYPPFDPAKLA